MRTKTLNRIVSIVMTACLLFSLLFCLLAIPASADSAKMIVWNKAPAYSRLVHRPSSGAFVAGGKYLYSFDLEFACDYDEQNFWRIYYRFGGEEDNFNRIAHDSLNIVKSDLLNGYHYDVTFTVPDDCLPEDNVLIKFGDAGINGYSTTMKLGNVDLWQIDDENNKISQIEIILPSSLSGITQSEDYNAKNYGTGGGWICPKNYLKNVTIEDQDGYFEPEVTNPFGDPASILRFYKGGVNVYAEYFDDSITLPAGKYTFGAKYKDFGTSPEFSIYYSSDNGATYSKAELTIKDTKKLNRTVKFTIESDANAIKIIIGNTALDTNVNLAIAAPYLKLDGEEKQLLTELDAATANIVDINAVGENKKWNIHTDGVNAVAVEFLPYSAEYFAPAPDAKTYQNTAGKAWARILYKNAAFIAETGKEYVVAADFKVLSGSFDYDDVCEGNDPAFRVKIGNYVLKNSNQNRFNGLVAHYDEIAGKLNIRFSPKTKQTKLEINVGSMTEPSVGSCAVGNVGIYECVVKSDGGIVYKDNLIKNITQESLYSPANGETANALDNRWNVIYSNSESEECKIIDYAEDYFKPSPAMIEIKEGAKGAYVSYVDDSLVLSSGKTYQLKMSIKRLYGKPEFSFAAKNIGNTAGTDYAEIGEGSKFLSYFNDEVDTKTFMRTISFVPGEDISDIRIMVGNISPDNESSVIVANASLYCIDSSGITVGGNLISEIIKPYIKINSTEAKFWNINTANETDVEVTAPIKTGTFLLEKMLKFEPNYQWNRTNYYDSSFSVLPNTTYRYTADFIVNGGNPTFTLKYYDKTTKDYKNFSEISTAYDAFNDKDSNIRGFEFTTKALSASEINNIGELYICVGNTTDAKDVDAVFANPQMYVIKEGKPTGDNLIKPITDETVQYMGDMNYGGVWNLRYQGSAGVALKVLDIPDNYFRVPAYIIKNASGTVSQIVTVKPDTYYRLSYNVKTSAGNVEACIKGISTAGSFADIAPENVKTDTDGYYNYSCEFKTPSDLRETNNLRVGFSFDNTVDGAVSDIRLYELNKGFEPLGVSIITDGSFTEMKTLAAYTGADDVGWTFEGTAGDSGISARSSQYFLAATPKMFIFVGGAENNYLSYTATAEKGKSYNLSFNLKYANIGYDGDTGVDITYFDGVSWKPLDCNDISPADKYKKSYNLTLPADAAAENNLKFSVRAGSVYVSGYIANAVLADTANPDENLLSNGDFSNGTIGWAFGTGFKNTYFADIPDGYFNNPQTNTKGMIVYRNAGSWENFYQTFLSLKSDTYYLLKAQDVHPWEPRDKAVFSFQASGTDDDGKAIQPFLDSVASERTGNSYWKLIKTPKHLDDGHNMTFRLVMQGGGGAGFWGDIELYECDENKNILSPNILINGDFSLGITGWTISPTDNFNYRIVEQPDKFFETYTKNGENMIVSNGTSKNAKLGQTIEVERGKTYYFTGFYVNMNAAGITPKVMYRNVNGDYVAVPIDVYYDADRFFFEAPFTLPDDADSYRGKTTVDFVLDNGDEGKAYISDIAVYEDGKYENLYKDPTFKNGFASWMSDPNYTLAPFDSSVFVFYYDDKKFDEGDWSGTATATDTASGVITGRIVDDNGDPLKDITVYLMPGRITTKTDSDGIYRFSNIKPGEYSLYIKTPSGEEVFVRDVSVDAGMSTGVSEITVGFVEDNTDGEIDVIKYDTEYSYGIVCGYLFDSDGNPIKGQKLYLGKIGNVTTKAKGIFQFDEVPPGEYDIYTRLKDGTTCILKRVKVVAGEGSIHKLRLPAESGFNFWWIILIAAGGAVILGGVVTAVLLIIKKKKS